MLGPPSSSEGEADWGGRLLFTFSLFLAEKCTGVFGKGTDRMIGNTRGGGFLVGWFVRVEIVAQSCVVRTSC